MQAPGLYRHAGNKVLGGDGLGWVQCLAGVVQGGASLKLGRIELVISSSGHVSDLQVA